MNKHEVYKTYGSNKKFKKIKIKIYLVPINLGRKRRLLIG